MSSHYSLKISIIREFYFSLSSLLLQMQCDRNYFVCLQIGFCEMQIARETMLKMKQPNRYQRFNDSTKLMMMMMMEIQVRYMKMKSMGTSTSD